MVGEKICEFEARPIEMIQYKQRKKNLKTGKVNEQTSHWPVIQDQAY